MDCNTAAHCGWADRIMACTHYMILPVHFEGSLYCRLVSDIFHYFRTMNTVGMFGNFQKVGCFIEFTVEYCLEITFLHISQGSAAIFYRWGKFITFLCQVSSGCRIPKIIFQCYWRNNMLNGVIHPSKEGAFILRQCISATIHSVGTNNEPMQGEKHHIYRVDHW